MPGSLENGTANRPSHLRTSRRRGHAIVEATLIAPWIFFLFVGVLDFGFYAYSLVSVENAARAAALETGASYWYYAQALKDPTPVITVACMDVRDELRAMPNYSQMPVDCSAAPLIVQVQPFLDSEGKAALRVSVTYETIPLIPIPGLVTGKLTATRVAEVRVFGDNFG